jgi:two-component system, NarL family, sensor kinase
VGIALYAARLSDDLQRARQRLVIAREEERRRMRNDLHDGLAPTLSALQLQLGAARNLLRSDPSAAEALLEELRLDLRRATAEIRQLVYDLRPPMLDELGLVGALRSLKLPGALDCYEVIAPERMPELSAALEVALYRIASEAVHNVVRHAEATECVVTLEATNGMLELCIRDNGRGLPPSHQPGVGLASMAERASELGGTLSVQACPDGGACLRAVFPLRIAGNPPPEGLGLTSSNPVTPAS